MLSKLSKLFLTSTSLAPLFLTLWFIEFSTNWDFGAGLRFLIIAIILTTICGVLIFIAKSKLESFPIQVSSIKTADKEIIGFVLVYLLPLISKSALEINNSVLYFILFLFFIIVFTTHSYHFNPLLGFWGYHFYEVTISGEISYVLISRKDLRNCKEINKVVLLSEYIILEA